MKFENLLSMILNEDLTVQSFQPGRFADGNKTWLGINKNEKFNIENFSAGMKLLY